MFKTLKKRIKNEKGLSLVELLAVIVIMAIIAVIAIPAIGNIINTSRDKGQITDAINIISGAKLAHIENGCGPTGCEQGKEKGSLEDFVDGKDVSKITVTLNGSEWKIKGYTINNKSGKFGALTGGTEIKESDLKNALDTGKAEATGTGTTTP